MRIKTLLFTSLVLLAINIPAMAAVEVGQPSPPLVVKELDGTTFNLADHKGHVVIVHFWATWCAPCREEMPVLDTFYQQTHAYGVDVIAVSIDRARKKDDVQNVMKTFHFQAALVDDAESNGYGTPASLPVTYIIDTSGIVRAKMTPDKMPLSAATLTQAVAPLFKK
jgi:thiol-disulfide isomerase/thioredoxin